MPGTIFLLLAGCALGQRDLPGIEPVTAVPSGMFAPPEPAAPQAGAVPAGPLKLSLDEAVLMTLGNNRSLAVERYGPAIARTAEEEARSGFDPVVSGSASAGLTDSPSAGGDYDTTESLGLSAAVGRELPSGLSLEGDLSADIVIDGRDRTRLGISATQPLRRGGDREANLASIRQARLDTDISAYELRGFAESLAAQVEQAYWDYDLAGLRIGLVEESLSVAQRQLDEVMERIKVGQMAGIEEAAARAEVALRHQALIDARGNRDKARLSLLRLLNPPGERGLAREVEALTSPTPPGEGVGAPDGHVATALRMRPDLNEARLRLQRGDLELVRTKNGLLPKLDLFARLGKSGYADSFGGTLGNLVDRGWDLEVGVTAELSPFNRAAQARDLRALLNRRQAADALANQEQLAEADVREAVIEINRLREQVTATAATKLLQEEKLRAETEKFKVGRSTSILVAQAQRDLLSAQFGEVDALVSHLKALVDLRRLEGSLLSLRKIDAPGAAPVTVVP